MSTVSKTASHRHADSPAGSPPAPTTFADRDVLAAIAARVSELLDGRAHLIGGGIDVHNANGRPRYRIAPSYASGTWRLEAPGVDYLAWIDLPAYTRGMEALGVETMARGIVAAVKRHARLIDEARDRLRHEAASPIRNARDLLISIRDHLASLGLEPDLGGDALTFLFSGHVHRLELEDLELRRPGATAAEIDMLAAGMPVG